MGVVFKDVPGWEVLSVVESPDISLDGVSLRLAWRLRHIR